MKVLLPVFGTHGDVLPFLAVGQELARRGHDVIVRAPAPFARHAARIGLPFHPVGTQAEYDAVLDRPEFQRTFGGLKLWVELGLRLADDTSRWIEQNIAVARTVVVAPPFGYGARIAQERFGLPVVTLHATPFLVESRTASPRLPGLAIPRTLPSRFRHWLSQGADRFVLDRLALPRLNAYRAGLGHGLPPVGRLRHWWNSPNAVVLMFPDWYAPPQLDWPLQTVQAGFPMVDRLGDSSELAPDLAAFLDAGEPPVVFTYSSWMRRAAPFFSTAMTVCRRSGRRGVLLAPQDGQVPPHLPPGMIHVPYAPLSLLLPRSAALVHHGGIGTVAQALAAGVPQIVVPFMGNHFDDGERVRRLGVGTVLGRRAFTAGRVARELDRLQADPNVARACAAARVRIGREDGIGRACDAIEALQPGQ